MTPSTRTCLGCGRRLERRPDRVCSAACRRRHQTSIERERISSGDWQPVALSEPMRARYGGRCPLCAKFIAKGRSTIVAIPPKRPSAGVRWDPDRLTWSDTTSGEPVYVGTRTWAHAKCVERAEKHHDQTQVACATEETA